MKTFLLSFAVFMSALDAAPRTQIHMGTLISVEADDTHHSDDVFALFKELDALLSTYKSDSEISRLSAAGELIVNPMTAEVLNRSLEMSAITDGAFDVTVGLLTHDLYRFGTDERLPSTQEITQKLPKVGYKRLKVEGNRALIDKNTTIDLGGIAKGYAVDESLCLLERHDVQKAVVAASGDIGCLGACVINVQDPFHPTRIIATLSSSLPRLAVSTSGNYERYIKNKKNNHLINPLTGKSGERYASITLVDTKDNTRIDALATAVSVMDGEKGAQLLESLGIGYLFIHTDHTLIKSKMPEGIVLDIPSL